MRVSYRKMHNCGYPCKLGKFRVYCDTRACNRIPCSSSLPSSPFLDVAEGVDQLAIVGVDDLRQWRVGGYLCAFRARLAGDVHGCPGEPFMISSDKCVHLGMGSDTVGVAAADRLLLHRQVPAWTG